MQPFQLILTSSRNALMAFFNTKPHLPYMMTNCLINDGNSSKIRASIPAEAFICYELHSKAEQITIHVSHNQVVESTTCCKSKAICIRCKGNLYMMQKQSVYDTKA